MAWSQSMGRSIRDKFSKIPNKHVRYRLRRMREGNCQWCGNPAPGHALCPACLAKNRKRGNARYARLHPPPVIPE